MLRKGKDKSILELGSTSWKDFIDFEHFAPAQLTCINISERELEKGIALAKKKHTDRYCKHDFKIADAHNMDFLDNAFDIVFGTGILHHLNFETAVKEIQRVLKPGGEIVFVEPLARNPIGKFVRKRTPEARTPDEKPLDLEEFAILKNHFKLDNSYFQLFYVPAGVLSKHIFKAAKNPLMHMADRLDVMIEKLFRNTNVCLYFRIVVIKGCLKS